MDTENSIYLMGIALVRVDERLVHGQVVEAWAPFCHATRIIVASEEAKKNRLRRFAIESCSSTALSVEVEDIEEMLGDEGVRGPDGERVIIIFGSLSDLMLAYHKGFRFSKVNIGNIHHDGQGKMLSSSVYIDKDDENILHELVKLGIEVDVRAMPSDKKTVLRF